MNIDGGTDVSIYHVEKYCEITLNQFLSAFYPPRNVTEGNLTNYLSFNGSINFIKEQMKIKIKTILKTVFKLSNVSMTLVHTFSKQRLGNHVENLQEGTLHQLPDRLHLRRRHPGSAGRPGPSLRGAGG